MTQRHFAKVLNSIDVGIAGDRLESSLLQLKVFAPSYSFHFVLFFCCESADVDLEYFCCPVWMVCWSAKFQTDLITTTSRTQTQWGRPPPRRVFKETQKTPKTRLSLHESLDSFSTQENEQSKLLFMQHALCYVGLLSLAPS